MRVSFYTKIHYFNHVFSVNGQVRDFKWSEEQQRSFVKLKAALATKPILVRVDPHKPFVLAIDASNIAMGAVLLQDGRHVAYESKSMTINYDIARVDIR